MKEHEINAGYRIKERFVVGSIGIALGENPAAPAPYVTWNYRGDAPSHFFWGHYFGDEQAAYDDYSKRIESEVRYYEEHTKKAFPLPLLCLTTEPSSGNLINIRLGHSGYYPSDWNRPGELTHNRETADFANEQLGVSKAQEAAMRHGSMFGWQTKTADPKSYDENGQFRRVKRSEPER